MPVDPGPPPLPPSASLTPHNPYAPPTVGRAASPSGDPGLSHEGAGAFEGTRLKWICVGAAVAGYAALACSMLESDRVLALVGVAGSKLGHLVGSITGLVWLAGAWSARPFPRAHVDASPGAAVGRLFIPVFGIYWLFAANLELADAVEPSREDGRGGRGSFELAGIARLACVLQIIAPLMGVFAPRASGVAYAAVLLAMLRSGAWLLFMFAWERRRALVAPR
jgi:hypothetical protein